MIDARLTAPRFQAFVAAGTVSPTDSELFRIVDNPEEAFEYLREGLTKYHLGGTPKKQGEVLPGICDDRLSYAAATRGRLEPRARSTYDGNLTRLPQGPGDGAVDR